MRLWQVGQAADRTPCCPQDTETHPAEMGVCSPSEGTWLRKCALQPLTCPEGWNRANCTQQQSAQAPCQWQMNGAQLLQIDEGESKTRQISKALHYSYCARIFLRLGGTINLICYQTGPKLSVACILSEWMSDQLNLLVQVTLLPPLTAGCLTYQDTLKTWWTYLWIWTMATQENWWIHINLF